MAYASLQFSRTQYNDAGRALITLSKDDPLRTAAIDKIGNWRASHALLMEVVNSILARRVSDIDRVGITSQRLKRLESIEIKLRHSNMRLTQMQDIGGCRAILQSVSQVNSLANAILAPDLFRGNFKFQVSVHKNYILEPKSDGYRGIHLIAEYCGESGGYKGFQIEIQVRTKPQHLWATSVEVCQFFLQQRFKTVKKTADPKWLQYLKLASGYIALMEESTPVSGIPEKADDIHAEMASIDESIGIIPALVNWTLLGNVNFIEGAYFYILDLSAKARGMHVSGFAKTELPKAEAEYLALEKSYEGDPSRQVVLVSVESLDYLRAAYPSYFVDTKEFVSMITREPFTTVASWEPKTINPA